MKRLPKARRYTNAQAAAQASVRIDADPATLLAPFTA